MFYDKDQSRVIIFGGWSNAWLGDMWSLNVSTITGPPYAIFGIKPKLGPLTGKTKVTIQGEGFKNSQNINVKFFSGKLSSEVNANFINEREL
jgi:dynein heavy chain